MKQKGQLIIELLVAMAVFVLGSAVVIFLILNAYVSQRAARETTKAAFLAEQGLEEARLTRNANWSSLVSLAPELIENKFTRTVSVEDIDIARKKVSSQVVWQITESRLKTLTLITYLTNWQAPTVLDCDTACRNAGFSKGTCKAPKSCKSILLGGLGEYQCSSKKACCCQ